MSSPWIQVPACAHTIFHPPVSLGTVGSPSASGLPLQPQGRWLLHEAGSSQVPLGTRRCWLSLLFPEVPMDFTALAWSGAEAWALAGLSLPVPGPPFP